MPAVRIVTGECVPSALMTVHTSATKAWTLSGDYGTARNDRQWLIWFSARNQRTLLQEDMRASCG